MKATPASNLNEFAAQVPASKLSRLAEFPLRHSASAGELSPSRTFASFAVNPHPDRTTKAARLYVSPRSRPLNQYEMETRGLSYLLKDHDCPEQAIHIAAREMAALVWGPCNLIPVPSHTGDTSANLRLARAIAGYVTGGATVFDLLTRTAAAPSACDRHRARLAPLAVEDHHITRRPGKPIPCRPSYLVDNVTTSGTTIRACRAALGFGSGLVFADAYHPHHT